MGSWFSSSGNSHSKESKTKKGEQPKRDPQANVTSKDRAILDLKNSKDRLKKFKKKLEVDSEKLTNEAKELIRQQKKERALLVLKLRKYKENELNQIDAKLLTVMEMIEQVEWESANMEVLKALKAGNDVLNKYHQEMSVEDVEALLEETNEAIEVENQINKLLAGQLNAFDEKELEDELSQIMAGTTSQSVQSTTTSVPSSTPSLSLPAAPVHLPERPPRAVEEEEEIRETRQPVLA